MPLYHLSFVNIPDISFLNLNIALYNSILYLKKNASNKMNKPCLFKKGVIIFKETHRLLYCLFNAIKQHKSGSESFTRWLVCWASRPKAINRLGIM